MPVQLMSLDEVKRRTKPVLRSHGVVRAAVFGSYARGEQTEDSDLDVLVEFGEGKSLLDLASLKNDLEEVLGLEVDVVTYNSLNPLLRDGILGDEVPIT